MKHVVAMGAHVLSKPAEKEWDTKTRHEVSVKDGNPDPLETGSYVLKVARPPQHQTKLHLKYTGPYKVVRKLRPDFTTS